MLKEIQEMVFENQVIQRQQLEEFTTFKVITEKL
jgi:hypothetical protein